MDASTSVENKEDKQEAIAALGSVISSLNSSTQKKAKKELREVYAMVESDVPEGQKLKALIGWYTTKCELFLKVDALNSKQTLSLETAIKEKEKLRSELLKSTTQKDKLEELCRSLQDQKKEIEAQSKRKIEMEKEQRIATQAKINESIKDINQKIEESGKEREADILSLRSENEQLRTQLGGALKQFETYDLLVDAKDQQVKKMQEHSKQQVELCTELAEKLELVQKALRQSESENVSQREHVHLLTQLNDGLKKQLGLQQDQFAKLDTAVQGCKAEMEASAKKHAGLTKKLTISDSKILQLSEENLKMKRTLEGLQLVLSGSSDVIEEAKKMKIELKRSMEQKEKLEALYRGSLRQLVPAP